MQQPLHPTVPVPGASAGPFPSWHLRPAIHAALGALALLLGVACGNGPETREPEPVPVAGARGARNPSVDLDGPADEGIHGVTPGAGAQPRPVIVCRLEDGARSNWLTWHQDDDGRWDADGFMKHDDPELGPLSDGAGNPSHDVGATGLALLALLGDGSTVHAGPWSDSVRRGLQWLTGQQDPESGLVGTPALVAGRAQRGRFAPTALCNTRVIYNHAIATYALVEAYGLSGKPDDLRPAAQHALNYLEAHRNPYMVWRYQPRDNDNDTSVTGWCTLACAAGQHYGLTVNPAALQLAGAWFDQVADPETGRHGYNERGGRSSRNAGPHGERFPREPGEAMTALALSCRFALGQRPEEHPIMSKAAALVASKPPVHDPEGGAVDHYYWFHASHALYQTGGDPWRAWSKHLKSAVVDTQRDDGNFLGSWDPSGVWGHNGGRVYSTALSVLTLQFYYRYSRLVRPTQSGR